MKSLRSFHSQRHLASAGGQRRDLLEIFVESLQLFFIVPFEDRGDSLLIESFRRVENLASGCEPLRPRFFLGVSREGAVLGRLLELPVRLFLRVHLLPGLLDSLVNGFGEADANVR